MLYDSDSSLDQSYNPLTIYKSFEGRVQTKSGYHQVSH